MFALARVGLYGWLFVLFIFKINKIVVVWLFQGILNKYMFSPHTDSIRHKTTKYQELQAENIQVVAPDALKLQFSLVVTIETPILGQTLS